MHNLIITKYIIEFDVIKILFLIFILYRIVLWYIKIYLISVNENLFVITKYPCCFIVILEIDHEKVTNLIILWTNVNYKIINFC